MRVAIVGSGIAGLGAAWQLRNHADVTVFEKTARLGGHSHTIMVPGEGDAAVPVDMGFIVYNRATYPNLVALFAAIGVATIPSDMSFAASLDEGRVEYAGDNLRTLIGHARNLVRPRHWRMLADLIRFMKAGDTLVQLPVSTTLGQFLVEHGYSDTFRNDHLLPMAGAIWSASPDRILDFPARGFGEFFRNHGLLEPDVAKRPEWRTVAGGSIAYVDSLAQASGAAFVMHADIVAVQSSAAGVHLRFQDGTSRHFDHIVLATHADQALALLPEALPEMRDVLAAFRYSANDTWLHRDETLMPRRKRLWASWNYMRRRDGATFVSYWMNRLQGQDRHTPYFVTLNPPRPPREEAVLARETYYHPQFDVASALAQLRLRDVQGLGHVWLCGSYCGFGFHEDALASGLAVAAALGAPRHWSVTDVSPAFANASPRPADV